MSNKFITDRNSQCFLSKPSHSCGHAEVGFKSKSVRPFVLHCPNIKVYLRRYYF